jgi:ABC-type dipeptide/oligopeptide/nickel transport system ATPase subunit
VLWAVDIVQLIECLLSPGFDPQYHQKKKKKFYVKIQSVLKKIQLDMVMHTCHPSYSGGRSRRIVVLRLLGQKLVRPYFENRLKA